MEKNFFLCKLDVINACSRACGLGNLGTKIAAPTRTIMKRTQAAWRKIKKYTYAEFRGFSTSSKARTTRLLKHYQEDARS